ncbi:uncharacterized protein LOC143178298 [Calliopsis andreniformis]|uniref:uncharacterized protein LOC143178298 n=1 Tax=Calliopsis andreniformis TaxID=337506 RepID=UPI003FCCFFAE
MHPVISTFEAFRNREQRHPWRRGGMPAASPALVSTVAPREPDCFVITWLAMENSRLELMCTVYLCSTCSFCHIGCSRATRARHSTDTSDLDDTPTPTDGTTSHAVPFNFAAEARTTRTHMQLRARARAGVH